MTSLGAAGDAAQAPCAPRPLPTALLSGRTFIVTRPDEQAAPLVQAIERAGARAIRLPTIVIGPVEDSPELDDALRRLADYDLVVFVSANAALQADARARAVTGKGLARVRCAAAPGAGTAASLAALGVERVLVPSARFDSEGLIAEIAQAGIRLSRALILRGSDDTATQAGTGRELLSCWLEARGAKLEVLACYRRRRADISAARRAEILEGRVPDAIVVTSSEGGENLMVMLGQEGGAWIADIPVFVPHLRIAERMAALGASKVHVTGPGDAGLMAGMQAYYADGSS
jgi:uroporphyrinogen-III synthase